MFISTHTFNLLIVIFSTKKVIQIFNKTENIQTLFYFNTYTTYFLSGLLVKYASLKREYSQKDISKSIHFLI